MGAEEFAGEGGGTLLDGRLPLPQHGSSHRSGAC
jgi:hypothetical protein